MRGRKRERERKKETERDRQEKMSSTFLQINGFVEVSQEAL